MLTRRDKESDSNFEARRMTFTGVVEKVKKEVEKKKRKSVGKSTNRKAMSHTMADQRSFFAP